MRHSVQLLLVLYSCFFAIPCDAQWVNIAQGLLGERTTSTGFIVRAFNGDMWAAGHTVFLSTDNGVTWVDRTPAVKPYSNVIVDIDFFDKNTGIMLTQNGGQEAALFYTTNKGSSWVESRFHYPHSCSFAGSRERIVVGASGHVYTSTDAGKSWLDQSIGIPASANGLTYMGNDKVCFLATRSTDRSSLFISTDHGLTWVDKVEPIDYDCYDLVYDSCSKVLFVPNEEWYVNNDNMADAYVTLDEGSTWNIMCSFGLSNSSPLTGAAAITANALYAQTGTRGVIRSTDNGVTWISIGGPNGYVDSRTLCAVSDDILYTVSLDGSIYRTTNAGGAPPITSTGNILLGLDPMFKDSIARRCGASMEETRSFMVTSCSPIIISSVEIEGVDKDSYSLLDAPTGAVAGQGSIRVAFAPSHDGHHDAQLVVRLADGTTRTIDLAGTADLEELELLVDLADFDLDTIGGGARVELTLGPDDEDIAAKVSFDPALEFDGVYSWDGSSISASASAGTVTFVVPKLALRAEGADVILQFKNVMAIPRLEYLLTVDSAAVVGIAPECVRTQALPSSSIKVAGGCESELYSQLLRDESITFRIWQGELGDALFVSSDHAGKVQFTLYDLMGQVVTDLELDLVVDRPVTLSLPGRLQGTYFALLRNNVTFKNHKLQLGIGY